MKFQIQFRLTPNGVWAKVNGGKHRDRHSAELQMAERTARNPKIEYRIVEVRK